MNGETDQSPREFFSYVNDDGEWVALCVGDHTFILYPAQRIVTQQLQSFIKFPPRQKPSSFNLDRIMRQLENALGSGQHLDEKWKQRCAIIFTFIARHNNWSCQKNRRSLYYSDWKGDK